MMTSPYWTVMNDLSNTITSYLTVRDLIRDNTEDPKYSFMNGLTEAEITAIIEQSIQRMMDDDESLLDSNE